MKILRTIILGIILVAMTTTTSYAENSIGLAAGITKGVGATFRHLSDNSPWGWQVTGLPVVMPDGGVANAGLSLLYVLHKGSVGLAHLSFGAAGGASWNRCTDDASELDCQETVDWLAAAGPGVGFELRIIDNFAFAGEFVLPVVVNNGEFEGLYPVPNMSLMYHW